MRASREQETNYCVLGFVVFALKVEVMCNEMISPFINCRKDDLHVKFTPASLLYSKWRSLEGYTVGLRQSFVTPRV